MPPALSYCLIAVLAVVTTAAPNPAVRHMLAQTPTRTLPSSSVTSSSTTMTSAIVLPRDPALNSVSAVSYGLTSQGVINLTGGSPVTLSVGDINELNAVASERPVPIAAFPSIRNVLSVAPSPTNGLPASLYSVPAPTLTGIRFDVGATDTTLYLYSNPEQHINKLSMGQVLIEALSELEELTTNSTANGWLPTSEWTYVRQKWNCVITAERNALQGPEGLPQYLTYGILHNTMEGLWGALFSRGLYYGARFEILDRQWGIVGVGSIAPWVNGSLPIS